MLKNNHLESIRHNIINIFFQEWYLVARTRVKTMPNVLETPQGILIASKIFLPFKGGIFVMI